MLMDVQVNGKAVSLRDGVTISQMLEAVGLAGALVAVEVNREVVKRKDHGSRCLNAGDVVEVVHFVGGG